jgi:glycosyltransferase A (GT-A) superfamily protein (DUF2064 family)
VRADRAGTIIVLAKEPRPGKVKTRLHSCFTPGEAAELAAASLADTIAAVQDSRAERRILAWDGDPAGWSHGFDVVSQPDGDLGARLAAAFAAAAGGTGGVSAANGRRSAEVTRSTLLIGMDTPQVSPKLLDTTWDGADAVLGLCEDGGFWAIGLRGVNPHRVFEGIPMSTSRTGSAQLARLADLGLRVALLPPLRDVDEPSDAEAVADRFPHLRFSRRYAELQRARGTQPVHRLFDDLYDGRGVRSQVRNDEKRGASFVDGLDRWAAPADPVDQMVVSRCEPPVIDIGCGPGRVVAALLSSGRAALGIDISRAAVDLGNRAGAQVLRRGLTDPLPGEGRWGTALLLDGNVGIGGDVSWLLLRCRQLVGPGGLIICEVDPDRLREERYELVLSGNGGESDPMPWATLGLDALQRVAATLDLVVAEEWRAEGRAFVSLRTAA